MDDVASRSAAYDRIGDLTVVGKHVAFRGTRDGADWIVVDGVEKGPFLGVRPGSLQLVGPGGERSVFAAADVTGERVHEGGAATAAWSAIEEVTASEDGRVAFVARDGAAFAVAVEGRLQGTFVWAGDLRMGRGGAVFAAREHGRDVVFEGDRRHDVDGLVRGSLRLAADGRTWGALVHRASGLGLETAHGRVELDLADLTGEMLRRRDGSASTSVLAEWMAAELERVAAAR